MSEPYYVMENGNHPYVVAELLRDEFFPDQSVDEICKSILHANKMPVSGNLQTLTIKEGTRLKLPVEYAHALARYNNTSEPGAEITLGGMEDIADEVPNTPVAMQRLTQVAHAGQSHSAAHTCNKSEAQKQLEAFAKTLDPIADKKVLDFINQHLGHKPANVERRARELKAKLNADKNHSPSR